MTIVAIRRAAAEMSYSSRDEVDTMMWLKLDGPRLLAASGATGLVYARECGCCTRSGLHKTVP